MSLEHKSKELKALVATYNTDWLLGHLSDLIHAGRLLELGSELITKVI